jgi:signal transduction histidine kinase
MQRIINKVKDFFTYIFRNDLYRKIPVDDILEQQRYRLFVVYSLAGMLISVGVGTQCYQMQLPWFVTLMVYSLAVAYTINYLLLQFHKNERIAYWLTVLVTFSEVHILTYFSNGIKDSSMMYLGSIILCAFMLLGNKSGKIIFLLSVLHLIYFYCVTTQTNWVQYMLVTKGEHGLEIDYLITGMLAVFFISSQANNLQGNKNIVIQKITESRNMLAEKNRQLEEYTTSLEKKNAELDKFASIVSHDLKAPLRAIGNLTGWIEEDAGESFAPDVRENFNTIKGRVRRMEDLINAILEYSKADRKKGDDVAIDTTDLLKDIVEFNGKPANCTVAIQEKMPRIISDKIKMQQVFSNLVNNAIKYNDKDKIEIKVSARETKDHYEFSVADNGPGIEEQYHEKIFVIFQTLNRRDDVESTGVGLAIVKKIIDEQEGKIWVESEPGKGANFKFILPKHKRKTEALAKAA